MNIPMLIWICVAVIALLIVSIRSYESLKPATRRVAIRQHIIEIGSEQEELYVPGDHIVSDKSPADYNEDVL